MKISSVLVLTFLIMFTFPCSVSAQKKSSAKSALNNTVQALPLSPQEQAITNLRAFAKLYGYVRYFHPSDEVTQLDWDKFAIYGAGKVKNARTTDELAFTLEELFLPIAPTLQILRPNEKSRVSAVPGNPIQHQVVAWQHKGIGLGAITYGRTYESIRLNRDIEDKREAAKRFRGELFAAKPSGGEVLLIDLAGGLQCALPIALYGDSATTLGSTTESAAAFAALLNTLKAIKLDSTALEQESVRLANVVMAWNVLQHSYPYFDVIGTNWNDALTNTLANTLKITSGAEFMKVMRGQLTEKLRDGHADYSIASTKLRVPVKTEILDGQLVVIASEDAGLKRGDVILSIDTEDVKTSIAKEEGLISGTPQWKRSQAAWKALSGMNGEAIIRIRRGAEEMNVRALRTYYKKVEEYPAIKQLSGTTSTDAIWYVDMSQISMEEFRQKATELADAKGLVFDLRGYPNGTHDILRYLTDKPLRSAQWNIPQIIYPDQERITRHDTSGRWTLFPMSPRMKGKIVFLTGGGAISYAESVMGIVEYYKLGDIVGETTAGANGNVNSMNLLGNARISWTGMKVLKHDGSQHHLVGIKPTVPAVRTVQGIRAGRDEVLEKALSLMP